MYSNARKEATKELKAATAKLTAVNTKISNLVKIIANGSTLQSLITELSKLEDEKRILEDKLNLIKNVDSKPIIDKTFISEILKNELKGINKLPAEKQKIILAKYIDKITVFPDKIEIKLKIDDKKISNKEIVGYDWWAGVDLAQPAS